MISLSESRITLAKDFNSDVQEGTVRNLGWNFMGIMRWFDKVKFKGEIQKEKPI